MDRMDLEIIRGVIRARIEVHKWAIEGLPGTPLELKSQAKLDEARSILKFIDEEFLNSNTGEKLEKEIV